MYVTSTRTIATRKCFLIFIKDYDGTDANRGEKKNLYLKLKMEFKESTLNGGTLLNVELYIMEQ